MRLPDSSWDSKESACIKETAGLISGCEAPPEKGNELPPVLAQKIPVDRGA